DKSFPYFYFVQTTPILLVLPRFWSTFTLLIVLSIESMTCWFENQFLANFDRPFLVLLTNSSDSHTILALHHPASMNCHCSFFSFGIFFYQRHFII
ncbi:hypothetical protein BpHYR1_021938, partial [Brachionus plicatilis]